MDIETFTDRLSQILSDAEREERSPERTVSDVSALLADYEDDVLNRA